MGFEEYVASQGDLCDSCGKSMAEGDIFLGDPSQRISWRFCCAECATVGATAKSFKQRFIHMVIGDKP